MPSLEPPNKTKLPFIRIITAACIGIAIGYFIFFIRIGKSQSNNLEIKGTICLVIDDYGFIFNNMVKDFLQLNHNITAAIIPRSPYARQIGRYADSLNIESIIHMPMESYESEKWEYEIDLSENLNTAMVEEKVLHAFAEVPTALGMNNHQGSKATGNLQLMKDLARALKKIDKFFLDSFTNPESRGYITMRRYGVPTQLRQVFLDHVEDTDHIKAKLDSLVTLSHHMEIAVGIGHVKPMTLEVLREQIPILEEKGYQFIRLSHAVR